MTALSNAVLQGLSSVWAWDGDWMKCRKCKRALVASRDGEELQHRAGCRHANRLHPWKELRDAISPDMERTP